MRKREIVALSFLVAILSMSMITGSIAFANDIYPVMDASTVVKWDIIHIPDSAFSMYFTGGGSCLVDEDDTVTFSVGEIHEDVEGLLKIGNVSVSTNDTDIARDLVLSVGIFTSFEPGLFVRTGSSNFESLNMSAYASAARVSGNFMNGTMMSAYENYTIGETEYETIIFDYEQDSPISGDPQRTRLIYDLETGVLLYANTSYWFGEGFEPYRLEIEFIEISHEGGYFPPTILYPVIIGSIIIILLISSIVRKKK